MNFTDEDIKQSAEILKGNNAIVSSTVKDVVSVFVVGIADNFTGTGLTSVVSALEQSPDFKPSDVIYLLNEIALHDTTLSYSEDSTYNKVMKNYCSLVLSALDYQAYP